MTLVLTRSDRYAIHLTLTRHDAEGLLASCSVAQAGGTAALTLDFDPAVTTGKRGALVHGAQGALRMQDDDAVDLVNARVVLGLSDDSLTVAIEKLEEARDTGVIASPEVCELRAGRRPDTNTLYVIVRSD